MIKENNKVFLATPISSYNDKEYMDYRNTVISLIRRLKDNGYEVYSEIEHTLNEQQYDDPKKAVEQDFNCIASSDVFLFHYPKKIVTSALIELGYALALDKKIIIVGESLNFPYLMLGIRNKFNVREINETSLSLNVIMTICQTIDEISGTKG